MLDIAEEMMLCPYNPSHVVKKIRIQKHILKCKKNYPEINLVNCIYNYSHMLKPEDMLQHYQTCRHKIRLDGARYYEADYFNRVSYIKSERQNIHFPDSNLKASFSRESKVHPQMDRPGSQELDSSRSDFEIPQLKDNPQAHISNDIQDSDTDSDLEPLPLPKTKSKAFVCTKKEPQKSPPEISEAKGFGRGRNFLLHTSPKTPQRTGHLLPDLSDTKYDTVKTNRSPWFYINDDSTWSQSVRSSMIDDATTLKSMDISLYEEGIEDYFILKNLDKYVKM